MNTPKRWLKRALVLICVFYTLKMAFEVWVINDFSGGKGFVSYSPDGQYKVTRAYKSKTPGRYHIVTHLPSNQVQAIIKVPWYYVDNGAPYKALWFCTASDNNSSCYKFMYDTGNEDNAIWLPPTLWQRVHAWLTIKIRGMEDMNLDEQPHVW